MFTVSEQWYGEAHKQLTQGLVHEEQMKLTIIMTWIQGHHGVVHLNLIEGVRFLQTFPDM